MEGDYDTELCKGREAGHGRCTRQQSHQCECGKIFQVESEAGEVTAQVCDVSKALLSVKRVVAAGNRVVFEPEQAYIEDVATGKRLQMQNNGGMYTLKMWVKANGQDFQGHGA